MGTIAPASASAADAAADADESDPYGDPDVDLETLPIEAIMGLAAASSRRIAREKARFVKYTRVIEKREGWRAEGATSLEAWMVERCGISRASARSYAHVGEELDDRPHLTAGLSSGDLTFDKVAAIVDVATPANDRELADLALECTVRQLQEVARAERGAPNSRAETDHESRSVRCNDDCHTVTAQLPPESYAQVKARLETGALALPSDGETRWDQRLCDVYLEIFGSDGKTAQGASPYVVVVHAPLETLADESSELAGELERGGLISSDTVRRLACDATVIVALDDDLGHTMYEGRARRFPTGSQRREVMRRDRHCRFPGCANVTFTNVHHIKPWGSGGRTDLENLVLMCQHHHYRLHSSGWSMTGNANEELTLVAPTGRVMTSRPSPLWATR
jgi:Domain of unknown function (DUF222)/HNH endonuclease